MASKVIINRLRVEGFGWIDRSPAAGQSLRAAYPSFRAWLEADLGDLTIPAGDEAALATISGAAQAVLDLGARLLALGGDHAISFPLLRAYGAAHPGLTVLHLDAHPDLYDELDGDRRREA